MKTAIVIPVWNLWKKMTFPCLQSIRRHTDLEHIHVYLVDNGSTDETPLFAEKMGQGLFGSHFTYIKNAENLGFAKACNQGAEQAHADGCPYVLFLNNDTLVTENWLPPLVGVMEKKEHIGLAGPLLLYPDNTVQHCGVVRDITGMLHHIYSKFPKNHPVIGRQREFAVITGAAMLARTHEFVKFGKFYEKYQNGFEDVDLCYIYHKHGYCCEVVHESVVYHLESQTPGRSNKEREQHNAELIQSRHKDVPYDAHVYYAKDGFVPALTKDFVFYVRLPEEKRFALNKKIRGNYSDSLCIDMIKQEPFWLDGYYFLIENAVKRKQYKAAAGYCNLASSVCFDSYLIDRFLECYALLGDDKEYEAVRKVLAEQKENMDYFKQAFYALKDSGKITEADAESLLRTQSLDIRDFGAVR